MAGGKGTRMSPFTNILPKPLLPINDKTMVENILDNFYESGFKNFIFTLNYKAKVLRAYIQEIKKNYSVKFTEEKKPLGTAGALKLIKNLIKSDMIVTNCDTSIQIDFSELIKFHVTKKNLITLVASSKEYRLPYGVCSLDKKGNLLSIQEKPSYDYLVNSGTYVINKKALKYIPNDKYFDMTDLINVIMKKNLKISLFPIHEDSWYDTGDWEQYRNVFSKMSIK